MAGYTFSKSVDVSSNLGEQVDPFNVAASEAPSAFDMRHNFVISYNYELPFAHWFDSQSQLATGWSISGTTRFSSGFPVTLYDPTDTSLLGTFGNGVNNNLVDTPNYAPGCDLKINHDPAKGPGFNTDCFSLAELGAARQLTEAFLLWARHRELRPGAHQARDVRHQPQSRTASRNVQSLQPSAVLRPGGGRRQHRRARRSDRSSPRRRRASFSWRPSSRSEATGDVSPGSRWRMIIRTTRRITEMLEVRSLFRLFCVTAVASAAMTVPAFAAPAQAPVAAPNPSRRRPPPRRRRRSKPTCCS